jgi:hypothetical protein
MDDDRDLGWSNERPGNWSQINKDKKRHRLSGPHHIQQRRYRHAAGAPPVPMFPASLCVSSATAPEIDNRSFSTPTPSASANPLRCRSKRELSTISYKSTQFERFKPLLWFL